MRGNPGSTASVQIVATTYLQADDKPNRNFVRFREGALRAIAKSYQGAPFLRDHNSRELLARGGTIIESEIVEQADGTKAFRQTIELVKPAFIEGALDGTIDRFSIGFRPTGPITCTICGAEFARGWFGLEPSCDHEPGQEYEVRGGAKRIAQAEFSSAEGVETSAVSVPAVLGTGIDDIRAALAEGELSDLFHKESPTMLHNIAKALGLTLSAAGTVDESVILAEIEKRALLLDAERKGRAEAEVQLAALREQLADGRRAAVLTRALSEGKCKPSGELHDKIVALALVSVDAAEALVTELPRSTPVGQGLASAAPPPKEDTEVVQLSESDLEVARQLRMTPAQFAASRGKKTAVNGRG